MERQITIIDSSAQVPQKTFTSSASNLGELKTELVQQGVNIVNKTFYEGHLRKEFLMDSEVFPVNIPYKGSTTNDLIFMITTTNKKIESGSEYNRNTIYNLIKEYGLKDACKDKYDKSYTNCSNEELMELIEMVEREDEYDEEEEQKDFKECCAKAETEIAEKEFVTINDCKNFKDEVVRILNKIVNILYAHGIINADEFVENSLAVDKTPQLSKKDIDEMFSFINN